MAPSELNDNQKYALTRALQDGETRRQERGLRRPLRAKDCKVPTGYRSVIATSTRRSLAERGLVTNPGWDNHLTAQGFKLAKDLFDEELRSDGGVTVEDQDDVPGVVFHPTNVEEYIQAIRKLAEARAKAHKEKVARAAKLWRNIKLPEKHYMAETRAIGPVIRHEFRRDDWNASLDLDLDDLIHIGEQIEALRWRAVR